MEKRSLLSRKAVIDALKEKDMRHSDLVKKFEGSFSEATVDRILTDLKKLGLIEKVKDEKGISRWSWHERAKPFKSEHDRERALQHSKSLTLGLEAVLAEIPNIWLPQESSWANKVMTEGKRLKPFALEHLKSYPEIYEKVMQFKSLTEKLRRMLEREGYPELVDSYAFERLRIAFNLPTLPTSLENKVKEIRAKRLDIHRQLTGDIRLLITRINTPPGRTPERKV